MKPLIRSSKVVHPLFRDPRPDTPNINLAQTKTRVVSLRPLLASDAPRLLALMSESQCAACAIAPLTTLDQAQRFITGQGYTHNHRYGVVVSKPSDRQAYVQQNNTQQKLVGGCAWGMHEDGKAYLSYWIFALYQRNGFARQAVQCLLKKIAQTGLTRVYAEVYADNAASIALLEGLGFVRQGESRHEHQRVLCLMWSM